MADSSAAPDEGAPGLSPDEAFALLGNETRIAILRSLWDASEPFADAPVSFSDLRERAGVRDSGQFNYHLEKLTGPFVERTDEGYELRQRGHAFVQAVLAGTAGGEATLAPAEVDVPCPYCGAPTAVSYEDEHLYHTCTECDGYHGGHEAFPPGTLAARPFTAAGLADRTPGEVLQAGRVQAKHERAMMVEGVCPACSGAVEPEVRQCRDHDATDGTCPECGSVSPLQALYTCSVCKNAWMVGPKLRVATHPAVVGFYYERGVEFDVATDGARLTAWDRELVSEDPVEIRVTVRCDGDRLDLTLDGELDVVAVREA